MHILKLQRAQALIRVVADVLSVGCTWSRIEADLPSDYVRYLPVTMKVLVAVLAGAIGVYAGSNCDNGNNCQRGT
jgi:hypothetical protein